jgi:hypothetical protein
MIISNPRNKWWSEPISNFEEDNNLGGESKEQETESKEQETESKEQETESKEQETESKEQETDKKPKKRKTKKQLKNERIKKRKEQEAQFKSQCIDHKEANIYQWQRFKRTVKNGPQSGTEQFTYKPPKSEYKDSKKGNHPRMGLKKAMEVFYSRDE